MSLDPHISCCVCYLHFFPAKNHGPSAMPGASPSECASNAQSLAIARTARKQCRTGGGKCLGCGKNGCEIPGKTHVSELIRRYIIINITRFGQSHYRCWLAGKRIQTLPILAPGVSTDVVKIVTSIIQQGLRQGMYIWIEQK